MSSNKTLTCVYIYEDRHAVLLYEKIDPEAGRVKFCEIHEHYLRADCRVFFRGRLVIHQYEIGLADLLSRAVSVRTLENGSESTRAKGITVKSLYVSLGKGEISFHDLRGCFSGGFTHQEDNTEVFSADTHHWCDYKIAKIHRAKVKASASAV